MGLSCDCDWCPDAGDKVYSEILDYAPLDTKRGRRCCSCHAIIKPGEICAEATRYKIPESETECRIYGEGGEMPLASHYMCEVCADLFNSLEELGFCVSPAEDQRKLVKTYAAMRAQQSVT